MVLPAVSQVCAFSGAAELAVLTAKQLSRRRAYIMWPAIRNAPSIAKTSQRLGDKYYYAQELFEQQEQTGYLKNMLEAKDNFVYEYVIYDSSTEEAFARELDGNEAVKVYAKLPGWFKVPAPLGSYNPDWAVLIEQVGAEQFYLVVETKGGLFADDLRETELAKIKCGKAHFAALQVGEAPVQYVVAQTLDDVFAKVV